MRRYQFEVKAKDLKGDLARWLQEKGVSLERVCGGRGTCGRCRVRLAGRDNLPVSQADQHHFTEAELAAGYRLACQLSLSSLEPGPLTVEIEEVTEEGAVLQTESRAAGIKFNPTIATAPFQAEPPRLEDLRADDRRLLDQLPAGVVFDWQLRRSLPLVLREREWKGQAVLRGEEIIEVLPEDRHPLGVAVDLGTTKIALYLIDLDSGATLATAGVYNPQRVHGADVISRAAYALEAEKKLRELQRLVVRTLNAQIETLTSKLGRSPLDVVEVVIVGNTIMQALLLGVSPRGIVFAPYVPPLEGEVEIKARELGLKISPGAYLYLPPVVAGFVGGDHAAVIESLHLSQHQQQVRLAVDIGTNTEVSLAGKGHFFSCSCASGPALEGMHISCGMRAAEGAIDAVEMDEGGEVKWHTIGDAPPLGVCGSGLIQAVAALLEAGAMDTGGRLKKDFPAVTSQRANGKEQLAACLVPAADSGTGRDICLTQGDVRQVQLAKGAIAAGIKILLNRAGLQSTNVHELILAGAFGTYLDVDSARKIGLIPPGVSVDQAGNLAGLGARQMLLDKESRPEVEQLVRQSNYIELTTAPDFQQIFVKAVGFPPEDGWS